LVVNQNGVKITQPGRIAYVRALFVPRHKSQVFVAQKWLLVGVGGAAGATPYTPVFQYVHPACGEERPTAHDIGAYEFGAAGPVLTCR